MILLALISLFPTPAEGAIGSIDLPDEIRRKLASESLNWACDVCGANSMSSLPKETKITESEKLLQNSMVSKIQFGVRKDRIPEEEEESKGVDPDDQANIYQEPVENSRIDHDDSKDDEKREERTVEESFAPAQNVREHRDASEISVNPKSELYFSAASLCFLFIIVSILLKKLLLKFSYKEEDISHHFN